MQAFELMTPRNIERPKENFTKDLLVLPSIDHIRELIDQDANDYANTVKSELIAKVENGRGKASAPFKYDSPHSKRALEILRKWAKCFDYSMSDDGKGVHICAKSVTNRKPWLTKAQRQSIFNGVKLGLGIGLSVIGGILFAPAAIFAIAHFPGGLTMTESIFPAVLLGLFCDFGISAIIIRIWDPSFIP